MVQAVTPAGGAAVSLGMPRPLSKEIRLSRTRTRSLGFEFESLRSKFTCCRLQTLCEHAQNAAGEEGHVAGSGRVASSWHRAPADGVRRSDPGALPALGGSQDVGGSGSSSRVRLRPQPARERLHPPSLRQGLPVAHGIGQGAGSGHTDQKLPRALPVSDLLSPIVVYGRFEKPAPTPRRSTAPSQRREAAPVSSRSARPRCRAAAGGVLPALPPSHPGVLPGLRALHLCTFTCPSLFKTLLGC